MKDKSLDRNLLPRFKKLCGCRIEVITLVFQTNDGNSMFPRPLQVLLDRQKSELWDLSRRLVTCRFCGDYS